MSIGKIIYFCIWAALGLAILVLFVAFAVPI